MGVIREGDNAIFDRVFDKVREGASGGAPSGIVRPDDPYFATINDDLADKGSILTFGLPDAENRFSTSTSARYSHTIGAQK